MKFKLNFDIYIGFRIKRKGTQLWWGFNLFEISAAGHALAILTWKWEGGLHKGLFFIVIPGSESINKFTLLLFGLRFGGGLKNERK